MSTTVAVLNGPNLNMLGTRDHKLYGAESLADVEARCVALAGELGFEIEFRQSNAEADMVDWIQSARANAAAIVINPAAFTHTSVAIHDALEMFDGPIIEVHISNIHAREEFRHHSYVSRLATGIVMGCGTEGYLLALRRVATLLQRR